MSEITVETLFYDNKDRLKLEILTSDVGFDKTIAEPELHRPGMALTGFVDVFTFSRVQIIGNTELAYLESLDDEGRSESLRKVLAFDLPCIIITDNNLPPGEMLDIAEKRKLTIFRTVYSTTFVMQLLSTYLSKKFAPYTSVHGSMVDVYGIGVLITGRSAIGKSEIALDLVERGHRLVADDVVRLTRETQGILIGTGSKLLGHHMEIRGIGIIDVRNIFGIRGIRYKKRVELEVHLEDWEDDKDYERTGLDTKYKNYLDVEIPLVTLPIFPGKNVTVIIESIALDHLLSIYGHHTAEEFNDRVIKKMKNTPDLEDYVTSDHE